MFDRRWPTQQLIRNANSSLFLLNKRARAAIRMAVLSVHCVLLTEYSDIHIRALMFNKITNCLYFLSAVVLVNVGYRGQLVFQVNAQK